MFALNANDYRPPTGWNSRKFDMRQVCGDGSRGSGSMYSKSSTPHLKYRHKSSTICARNSTTSPRIHFEMTWRVSPVSRATVEAVMGRASCACFLPISSIIRFFTAISILFRFIVNKFGNGVNQSYKMETFTSYLEIDVDNGTFPSYD